MSGVREARVVHHNECGGQSSAGWFPVSSAKQLGSASAARLCVLSFPTPTRAAAAAFRPTFGWRAPNRSEEHTSELQSLLRISYAVFCLNKNTTNFIYYVIHTNTSG